MTCHADLSVDEVVLDLYLLPVSRFISEHPWFKVYAPFPPYKYQQTADDLSGMSFDLP